MASTAASIAKFFGKKGSQTIVDLMDEIKTLTDQDRVEMDAGIKDGSLTY